MINSSLSVKGKKTTVVIEKKCGNHSTMRIDIIPDNMDEISGLLSFVSMGTAVEADIDGNLVMCGKISNITGKSTYSGAAVSVSVISDSIESDMIKKSRIFQSPEKIYKDITDKITDKVVFKINDSNLSSKKEENVVIQYNESDFEFANRISAENNKRLFVRDRERGKSEVIIDEAMDGSKTLDKKDIISVSMDLSEFCEILEIEYREYIELGTKVTVDNNEYVVTGLKAEYKDDNDRFFFRLEKIIKQHEEDKNSVSLLSLGTAKVTDNKDSENLGRIQVEFLELEDALNDKKIWIQYINTLTADEGGVFFVPDKDEKLQIICQNGVCFAYGCVRQKAASDRINDTDKKSIMLYDKTLVIEEKKITLVAKDYEVQVNEEELYIKNKDYNITMDKKSVYAGNKNNTATIDKNKIELNFNKQDIIKISNSTVSVTAHNTGKIQLKPSKLNISASMGVEIKTSKVDIK